MAQAQDNNAPQVDHILRMPKVIERTGLSRATIYRRMEAGTFPERVELGGSAVGWYESEISEWQRSRPRAY